MKKDGLDFNSVYEQFHIKIRLHRARTRLKAEFEVGCDFYHDEDGKLACDRKSGEAET